MNTQPPIPRVLIVDDQPANLQVLGSILGQQGYDVVPAADGPTALKRLAVRPPDLVLLDLMMPGMDGFEVCRRIREQAVFADVPVIFLSAADEKSLIIRALDSGGVDYVTKPFNQAELIRRVQTQLALKAARDRLQRLAEDKDELMGILAHDLKNTLGSMQMCSRLLVERTESDPPLQRLALTIEEATERTLTFVKQFLANAAAEHGFKLERTAVNLGEIAAEVVRDLTGMAHRKQLQIRLELPTPAPAVQADRIALRQIVDNLVSNAVKFSPPGRTIWVRVVDGAQYGECHIQDEGPGFTAEDHTRMFRRYSRLSARPTGNEPGTGLGLSIARKLVGALNGEIQCHSEAGKGATFVVRLPRARSEPPLAPPLR